MSKFEKKEIIYSRQEDHKGKTLHTFRMLRASEDEYALARRKTAEEKNKLLLFGSLLEMTAVFGAFSIMADCSGNLKMSALIFSIYTVLSGVYFSVIKPLKEAAAGKERDMRVLSAEVKDYYFVDMEKKLDGKTVDIKGYVPIYECDHDGRKLRFELHDPRAVCDKEPVLGEKRSIIIDPTEPSRSYFGKIYFKTVNVMRAIGAVKLIIGAAVLVWFLT